MVMQFALGKLILVKILHYFSLTCRLKGFYISSKATPLMRWPANGCTRDDKLRYPADAEALKAFDNNYPGFASDPRNIRLCLMRDGFNPFENISTQYSI